MQIYQTYISRFKNEHMKRDQMSRNDDYNINWTWLKYIKNNNQWSRFKVHVWILNCRIHQNEYIFVNFYCLSLANERLIRTH